VVEQGTPAEQDATRDAAQEALPSDVPRHCENCGTALPGESRFCPQCGLPIRSQGTRSGIPALTGAGQDSFWSDYAGPLLGVVVTLAVISVVVIKIVTGWPGFIGSSAGSDQPHPNAGTWIGQPQAIARSLKARFPQVASRSGVPESVIKRAHVENTFCTQDTDDRHFQCAVRIHGEGTTDVANLSVLVSPNGHYYTVTNLQQQLLP
jgi:hypothetical protein